MTGEDRGNRPGRTVRLDALIDAAGLVVDAPKRRDRATRTGAG